MIKDYFVYIIGCSNGRLYTGYTIDIEKRFQKHVSGKGGAKFTRAFKPQCIEASWKITGERGDAMRVESYIKSLDKKEKLEVTADPESLIHRLMPDENRNFSITVFHYNSSLQKICN